jgi:osmotically inducible protein OsmC
VKAKIEGISEAKFQELVTKAERTVLFLKLLNTAISTAATLVQ